MKIEWVKKLDADGMHNAFTGLAYFKDKYYLAYRKAKGHVTDEAFQVIMTSDNGKNWKIEHKKCLEHYGNAAATVDYRDSFFLPLDDKLLLYSFVTPVENGSRGNSYSLAQIITADSTEWPEPELIQKDCIIWKPVKSGEDFYAAGYVGRCSFLYKSQDGMNWKKKSYISPGSETCLYAPDKEKLVAFVRTEREPYHLEIYESAKPFDNWSKINEIPVIIQCPHVLQMNDKVYILGRERPDYMATADKEKPSFSAHRTKIWEYENNSLKEVLELPSMGDNSYPGTAVMPDGSLLISYYSQHETGEGKEWKQEMPSDIFIAKIHC